LEISGAADQGWRHVWSTQCICIANIRKKHCVAPEPVRKRQVAPTLVFIQLGPNRILCLERLVDWIVDHMLLAMTIDRKPVATAGVESDTTTLDFNAQVAQIRVADHEIGFAVLGLLFLPTQDPTDLEKDDKLPGKSISQRPVNLRLRLRRQVRKLGIR